MLEENSERNHRWMIAEVLANHAKTIGFWNSGFAKNLSRYVSYVSNSHNFTFGRSQASLSLPRNAVFALWLCTILHTMKSADCERVHDSMIFHLGKL